MPIRANNDPKYYRRFMLIGFAALGFALWLLYDGAIAYPNQRIRALEYIKLVEEDRRDEWKEIASKNGWPTAKPGEPKEEADSIGQYAMAVPSTLVGLWLLLGVWRSRGRWIEASETGLTSSWGQSFDYTQVVAIEKKKWKDKGIAYIRYQQGNRKKRFVLDDYKFDRQLTDKILFEIEARCGTDKIVGGRPETPPVESS